MKVIIALDVDGKSLCTIETPPKNIDTCQSWIIQDRRVVYLLHRNGFLCYTDHPESRWHTTNCPISFNGTFTLPDGHILESHGTALELAGRTRGEPMPQSLHTMMITTDMTLWSPEEIAAYFDLWSELLSVFRKRSKARVGCKVVK